MAPGEDKCYSGDVRVNGGLASATRISVELFKENPRALNPASFGKWLIS
jgi:hypothetical protein